LITENLSTLKIHKLSQAQYDREFAAGNIDGDAIYLTPDEQVTLLDLGVTATASELNKMDGVTATTTELNYCDGVTSNIQTQLDNKVTGSGIFNIIKKTQSEYDAMSYHDPNTLYVIVG
jgi:hypothetical protein